MANDCSGVAGECAPAFSISHRHAFITIPALPQSATDLPHRSTHLPQPVDLFFYRLAHFDCSLGLDIVGRLPGSLRILRPASTPFQALTRSASHDRCREMLAWRPTHHTPSSGPSNLGLAPGNGWIVRGECCERQI